MAGRTRKRHSRKRVSRRKVSRRKFSRRKVSRRKVSKKMMGGNKLLDVANMILSGFPQKARHNHPAGRELGMEPGDGEKLKIVAVHDILYDNPEWIVPPVRDKTSAEESTTFAEELGMLRQDGKEDCNICGDVLPGKKLLEKDPENRCQSCGMRVCDKCFAKVGIALTHRFTRNKPHKLNKINARGGLQMRVSVPPGVQPGQPVQVQDSGRAYQVNVPAGVAPGQAFHVQVPQLFRVCELCYVKRTHPEFARLAEFEKKVIDASAGPSDLGSDSRRRGVAPIDLGGAFS